jgi:hypothetical protein
MTTFGTVAKAISRDLKPISGNKRPSDSSGDYNFCVIVWASLKARTSATHVV